MRRAYDCVYGKRPRKRVWSVARKLPSERHSNIVFWDMIVIISLAHEKHSSREYARDDYGQYYALLRCFSIYTYTRTHARAHTHTHTRNIFIYSHNTIDLKCVSATAIMTARRRALSKCRRRRRFGRDGSEGKSTWPPDNGRNQVLEIDV